MGLTIAMVFGCGDSYQEQKVDNQIDFEKEKQTIMDSHENWRTFGDYIGGLLNPLFSFLSF